MLARFVRAGVTAARFAGEELIDSPDYYAALGEIAAVAGTGGRPGGWPRWAWDQFRSHRAIGAGTTRPTG